MKKLEKNLKIKYIGKKWKDEKLEKNLKIKYLGKNGKMKKLEKNNENIKFEKY